MDIFPWRKPKIPVIALRGIIAARPGAISLEAYADVIDRGFSLAKRSKNLVLAIESPGGSAAQSVALMVLVIALVSLQFRLVKAR